MPLVGAFSALWQYSDHTDTTVDPGAHQFRTDNPSAPTALSISTTDDDNGDRHDELAALGVGDHLVLRSTTTSGDYGSYVLTATPVDNTTWFALAVVLSHPPTAPGGGAPPAAERVLLDFVRWAPDPEPAPIIPSCVPWQPDYSCCEGWADLDLALQARATTLAWATLQGLSGGQVGNCPVTVRPCLTPPCSVCNPGGTWLRPFIRDGNWYNAICGRDPCSCERLCEVVTPGLVAELVSVVLDGVEVGLENFRVDNGNRIVRTDGECWPSCQDMNLALDQPGTLGIEYVPGIVPDAAGLWAAGVLACEFSKACSGLKCRLPTGVSTISRQGVVMTISSGMFPNGMTGIREVDAYLSAINPHALRTPPMVWSPDVPWARHRYATWSFTA